MKPEEYTIYERVPALSPGSFDERHMRRNLRITKLYGGCAVEGGTAGVAEALVGLAIGVRKA